MKFITAALFLTLIFITGCKTQQTSSQSQSPQPQSSSSSSASSSNIPSSASSSTSSPAGDSGMPTPPASSSDRGSFPTNSSSSATAMDFPSAGEGTMNTGDIGQTSGEQIEGIPVSSSTNAGMTTEETVAVLDEQLNASLGVFDGMILTERAAVQDIENGNIGDPALGNDDPFGDQNSSGSEPLFDEGNLSESGEGEENTVADMPSSTSNGASGPGQQAASTHGTVPADLIDGSDDNIVARQIREAAMNEPDPELRAKLWDEYRKYKKGS